MLGGNPPCQNRRDGGRGIAQGGLKGNSSFDDVIQEGPIFQDFPAHRINKYKKRFHRFSARPF